METAPKVERRSKGKALQRDSVATYNKFKEFEGKHYTGRTVGRRHKWYYDKGEWKESDSGQVGV